MLTADPQRSGGVDVSLQAVERFGLSQRADRVAKVNGKEFGESDDDDDEHSQLLAEAMREHNAILSSAKT